MAQSILQETREHFAERAQQFDKAKEAVSDAVDDFVGRSRRAWRHGRDAAEDLVEDASRTVKRYPWAAVGAAFGCGVLVGSLAGFLLARRR